MKLKLFKVVKLAILVLPTLLYGQERYWVFFADKAESIELFKESDFLSEESINRRNTQGIELKENDYPVSPSYVNKIQSLGFEVYRQSRWLNAVSVYLRGNSFEDLKELPFVSKVQRVNKFKLLYPEENFSSEFNFSDTEYGPSFGQIAQLNGHQVHEQGYKGQGINIAVIDASFYKVDTLAIFDSLWVNNRILDTWDFVLNQELDYTIDTIGYHGTMVLSCMGANMKDSLIGTAPEASYMLYRTEDSSSETLAEEDNWVAAAEIADVKGADVVNTSLGYSILWDDTLNSHSYEDMDGNTTIITVAADIAASKGMLVVNSAGNSGNSEWYYITAPADGDSVLAVGAVGADSVLAFFSSHGPSADGRMKPNVVAQGYASVVCNLENGIRFANGTSFSAPILSGMAASVWSAMPEVPSMDLFNMIQSSAHMYYNGDNNYGYGIPDFNKVLQNVGLEKFDTQLKSIYPNPFEDFIVIDLSDFDYSKPIELSVLNQFGEHVYIGLGTAQVNYRIDFKQKLPKAFYVLRAKQGIKEYHWKVVK